MTKIKHCLQRLTEFPGFWLGLLALIILFPIIGHQEFWTGYDTYFHMNTIYEDAMQIKTGHYSYFLSMFGFERSGRIVNSLYGPFFSYFCGALLLLCHSWVNFEFVLFFTTMVISGYGVYGCARLLKINRTYAIVVGMLYILSRPIIIMWLSNFEFTGLGAAILLPFVLMIGIKIFRQHRINVVPLAIMMAVCLQIHLITSLVAVAILVPLTFCGFMMSQEKWRMVRDGVLATVIVICLSGNIFGAIYDVYSTNRIIPTFPNFNLQNRTGNKAIALNGYHITDLKKLYTFLIVLVLIAFIFRLLFKRRSITGLDGCLLFEDLAFLWGSSTYFPWNRLVAFSPKLSYLIQFPSRFITAPILLTLLLFGDLVLKPLASADHQWKLLGNLAVLIIFICTFRPALMRVNGKSRAWQSPRVVQYWTHHTADRGFRYTYNGSKIRAAIRSHDLGQGVNVVHKVTPDYLPTPTSVNLHRYFQIPMYPNYIKDFANQKAFHKTTQDHQLRMTWRSHNDRTLQVPLVKYGNTQVTLNHKRINPSRSVIGTMNVKPRTGRNVMTMRYQPGMLFKLLSMITLVSWLIIIGLLVIKAL